MLSFRSLQLRVVELLTDIRDIVRLSATCKQLKDLVQSSTCWSGVTSAAICKRQADKQLALIAKHCPGVRIVDLSSFYLRREHVAGLPNFQTTV